MILFRTVAASLCLALSVVGPFVEPAAGQASQSTGQPAPVLSGAEFPPYDARVWTDQRNGLAARRLTEQPVSPEITELLQQNRIDDALRVLREIVDKRPDQIPRAFEIALEESHRFSDRARGYPDALQDLVNAARKKLPGLPRETAARAERQLLVLDRQPPPSCRGSASFGTRLQCLVQEYAGTETALLTEVDVIEFSRAPMGERLDALDKFVRDHPGTIAAAKALHLKAFQLAINVGTSGRLPPGTDPTDRFMEVLDIVKEIESGRYPPSKWAERAQLLVGHFFASNPTYAPGNIDRLIDTYQEFVRTHFSLDEQYPLSNGSGYIITTKMADLFTRKGEGLAGVERSLDELERDITNVAGLRYLRAQFYMRSMNSVPAPQRPVLYQKAIDTLAFLQAQGNGLYQRKALATLASLYFSERDYPSARETFTKDSAVYPQSPWAWVAALRIGQSDEALGDWKVAVDSYLAAASKYSSVPFARVLGHAYAARGYEALGQFDRALREYQTGLAVWDTDYGPTYSLHVTQDRKSTRPLSFPDNPEVARQSLPGKIAQLKNSISVSGGILLERGRWLIEHGRHGEALVPLEQLLTQYRQSPAIPEARYLVHLARIGGALELADVRNPKRDEAAALAQLDVISNGPYDFGVCAAKIGRASILWKSGASAGAESLMMAALREWYDQQSPQRQRRRENIERDIAEIRNLVIRPNGDGV